LIGHICDEKYRVIRLLGQGGMGSVYEAVQVETGQLVALKCVDGDLLVRSRTSVSRFQREAKAMGAIDTDHIVRVLDAGVDPATRAPYMVMELLDGEDLHHLLARVERLEPDTALRITAQICFGLQKAHEARVVHRDIKPANVFLARRGDGEIVVKILDFGIAKIKPDASEQSGVTTGLTRTGGIVGSPAYMSPEQARGLSNIDYTTDLWSLGVLLYRCLSGTVPHDHIEALGDMIIAICSQTPLPIQSLAPWVRPEAAAVVRGALQIEIGDRFPTATAMLDAILPLLPEGWSLREDLLNPLSEATRATIAPELPGAHSSDNARQRLARITARARNPFEDATTAHAPVEPPPPASALAVEGSATTAERSFTTTGANPSAAPRPDATAMLEAIQTLVPEDSVLRTDMLVGFEGLAPQERAAVVKSASQPISGDKRDLPFETTGADSRPHSPPARSPWPALAGTTLAAMGVVIAYHVLAPPSPPPAPMRRAHVIIPNDALAEVDRIPVPVKEGAIEVTGRLGSVHSVRIFRGPLQVRADVCLTEEGVLPRSLDFPSVPSNRGGIPEE
jgi:eukaryotic-like serine/threonine-protein kinase